MTVVVVAEDDADIRDLLVFKLTQGGFDVTAVGDGSSALSAIADVEPDLVILDVMMPGVSGLEVCRRLRSDPSTEDLPVVMLTARAREDDIETGFGVGADDYLTKPFSPNELIHRVHTLLSRFEP
ncbi:hypothetical protein Lesp02_23290 [Lentzea sp. NBRC 105346]|uniref:response regulator transcription factor n=1 Tax=Lentzea sp. NBRC 105346 TaxID=3032205 RepID=UPI0024A3E9E7|nr:response regulator [Lentzea sp. NBRC 105346]GLZ30139.1 hypothetical protein Lesp02_23290 [Lentzea sp. NBRC 105346]